MKISIVTATYNSGVSLRDTLESVLSQTYDDYEHIIVDGGSTDNTLDILREYEPRYKGRLKWHSEPDRGIYDAMNKGIIRATGELVGLLNSDDFYTSDDVLASIAESYKSGGVDAVYGDVCYVHPNDLKKMVRRYSSASFSRWKMRLGFMPAHPSFYCRRSVYMRLGMFDLRFKIAADFEQLLRLIFVNNIKTRYIPKTFVTMRTGGASTSGLSSHKQIYHDHMMAYKVNGVYSNCMLESMRYMCKICERIRDKIAL